MPTADVGTPTVLIKEGEWKEEKSLKRLKLPHMWLEAPLSMIQEVALLDSVKKDE